MTCGSASRSRKKTVSARPFDAVGELEADGVLWERLLASPMATRGGGGEAGSSSIERSLATEPVGSRSGRSSTIAPCPRRPSPRRRPPGRRGHRRRDPPHADVQLPQPRPGQLSEGGALPADRLVQGARRAQPGPGADGRRARTGRDQRLGRKPCAGAGLGGRRRGDRRAPRDVAGRERRQDRRDPRATGPPSTSRRQGPGRRSSGCASCEEETGRVFVHPFDDPIVIAGAGTVGLEILEDVPDVDTVVVACGGGGLVSGIAAACVPAGVRVVAVEPERSNALALGLAAGEPVPVTPRDRRRRADGAVHGELPIEICGALGVDGRARLRRRDRGGLSGSSTAARSWPPSRAAPPPSPPCSRGRWRGTASSPSSPGGNVSADIASAILARP